MGVVGAGAASGSVVLPIALNKLIAVVGFPWVRASSAFVGDIYRAYQWARLFVSLDSSAWLACLLRLLSLRLAYHHENTLVSRAS